MIPYRSPLLTAVPQTFEKRQEVVRAMRALAVQEHDAVHRRRAEVAALHRDCALLAQSLRDVCREYERLTARDLRKYNPDQPRVPAGNPDGGEWTTGGGGIGNAPNVTAPSGSTRSDGRYHAALDAATRTEASSGEQPRGDAGQIAQALPPVFLFEDPPLVVRPPLPEFPEDPTVSPGPGFEWKGRPGSQPGDPEGSWYNPSTRETLRPNMDHDPPIGPHWDYKTPNRQWYRWFPDGRFELKS